MAEHRTVKKRHKQSLIARDVNRASKSAIRTSIKQVKASLGTDEATAKLSQLTSLLDKASKKHLLHKRTVARIKSRLTKKLNQTKPSA